MPLDPCSDAALAPAVFRDLRALVSKITGHDHAGTHGLDLTTILGAWVERKQGERERMAAFLKGFYPRESVQADLSAQECVANAVDAYCAGGA